MNLRRILEFVGLIAYCDFDEQVHVGTEEGAYRPDCVITIPGSPFDRGFQGTDRELSRCPAGH